jgi:hypothetical protein
MYKVGKITWIKNVKHRRGEGWAYEHVSCDQPFLLNWPTSKPGSVTTAKIGDIIVLFQKPNQINGRRNRKVHLTHLVVPISDEVFQDPGTPNHKWCRQVQLIAKANPIEAIPNPGYLDFFLPNRGLTNKIANLENTIGLSQQQTISRIWELFSPFLCENISFENDLPKLQIGQYGEEEGDIVIRDHIRLEIRRRNSRIVQLAKSEAYHRGNGRILCECCDFDFFATYGGHGLGFIECHHKNQLAAGERITTLANLALVCSNCHRMLHRPKSNNEYYTVEELRELILANSANQGMSA